MKSFFGTFFNCCSKTNNNKKKQLLHEDATLIITKEASPSSKVNVKGEDDDYPKPPYNSPVMQFEQKEAEPPIFNISASRNEETGRSLFTIEILDTESDDSQIILNPDSIYSFIQNSNQTQQSLLNPKKTGQNSTISGFTQK